MMQCWLSHQFHKILNRPQPIRHPSRHRRSNAKALVDAHEIVVHVENPERGNVVLDLLGEDEALAIIDLVRAETRLQVAQSLWIANMPGKQHRKEDVFDQLSHADDGIAGQVQQ